MPSQPPVQQNAMQRKGRMDQEEESRDSEGTKKSSGCADDALFQGSCGGAAKYRRALSLSSWFHKYAVRGCILFG